MRHNTPESANLSPEQRAAVQCGAEAIMALKKTFDHWMAIAHRRQMFYRLLEQNDYGVLVRRNHQGNVTGKSALSRLEKLVEHETEVRAWRTTLSENQQWEWASPSAIFKHCPLFHSNTDQDDNTGKADERVVAGILHNPAEIFPDVEVKPTPMKRGPSIPNGSVISHWTRAQSRSPPGSPPARPTNRPPPDGAWAKLRGPGRG